MPQVKGEHRGALVNFLNARGISSTKDEVPAASLKPTQAEFSREKTERFMKTGPIGERSVLVSSDGHVLDGHHQWMAMKALGESIPVIRLDAPIRQLLDEVREFPSVQQSEGDKTPVGQRAAAVQDFKDALGDLAQIASKHTRAAMMPEKTPDLMPVLAKLFDAAIRLVGTDMKRATKWVREQIKADPRFKTFWNKISPEIYQKAALQAMEGMANPAQDGLFGDIGEAASAVQDDLFNSPAKATEDTSAVSKIESKAYDRDRDNYRPPSAKTFLPAELIARANGYIGKYSKQPRPMVVAPKDRARAKAELKPLLDAALGAFQGFARNVAAVAQQSGALGQIVASVKNMDRAVEKYVDPDGADFSPERMRDLLRATVVVSSYGDVQAVVDAVVKVFGSVARVKTRISEDARIDGYADVLLNVVLPDGVAAEIQINVPQMLAAKDAQGHKLYEAQRVQPEASAAYKEIGDAMREFYDAAFAAAGNNLTLPVAANSRQPRAQFKKTASEIGAADRVGSDLTGSKSDPLSSSLKTLPSGSSTNSSPLNDATNSQPGGNLSGTFIGTPPASILRADAKNSEPEPAGAVRTATQIAADIAKAQPDGDVAALREQARDAIVAELGPQALDAMEPGSFMRADGLTQAIHDGQYEALREYAAAMPVPVQESDIPRDAATQAYSGTSHSPEQRGASARRNYVRALVDAWKQTEATLGDDAAARARAVDVLGDVVEGYRSRYLEALGASARVMSAMIAGPARFPVEANRKKSETADKRAQEASEFLRKGIARMAKAARGPIDNSPDSDVARIRANLEEREATQERMKAVNAALRKKDDAPLVALGYSPALIAELKKPDFAGRRGYADYKLANNNAEIRRLRERLAQAEQRVSEAAAGPVETTREGVRIEENAQDDRLRLFFDEKPGEAVRTDLKARGFKWSPNAGAWQRQLTDNARAAAERVLNDHYPKNDGKDVSKLSRSTSETGGMDFDALDALASDIARKNPRMPKVNVLADQSKAPKALRDYITEQGAENDVDGAMHDGELYLFASGLPDALRAEHVLAEHEAAHFGLRAILGDSLTQAMNLIYANNGAVRKAATEMQRRGKLSDAAAVEEIIVDMPNAQLVQLKGWRKVTALARDWLAAHGFTEMSEKLSTWLDGTLTDQQRADLFVADLVRGARAYVAGKGKESTGAKVAGTRLSATLADDLARQEKWLTGEARGRGFKDIEDLLHKNYPAFEKLAELWRRKHPGEALLSRGGAFDSTSPDIRLSRGDAAIQDAPVLRDTTGVTRQPEAKAPADTAQMPPSPPPPKGPWQTLKERANDLISAEHVDKFLYEFQDKLIDLKRLRDHIKSLGGTINDLNDAYLGEELYHKRVAKRTEDFLRDELKPLLADMRSRGVVLSKFEEYLHARHAPEANKEMALRNPNQAMIDAGVEAADAQVRELELALQKAQASGSATAAIDKALEQALRERKRWHGAQAFRGTEEERTSLSGMTDGEAAAVMAGMTKEQAVHMRELAARVDAMTSKTMEQLKSYGLADPELLKAWKNAYEFYVPLHRDEAHPGSISHPVGQGFSVKGPAGKRRVGSNAKVTHILGHIAMARESALTRGEKNMVTQKLYIMAAQNPDPDWWQIDRPPKVRTIDPDTGLATEGADPNYKNQPNVLMLKIAGKDAAIVFNERNERAARLAASMKNLDAGDLHVVMGLAAKATRWFASVNTQYNPVFGAMNFARDVQGALLNLSSTPIKGKELEVTKNMWPALKAIYADQRAVRRGGKLGDAGGEWGKLWADMQDAGGTTGYRDLYADPKDRAMELEKLMAQLERGGASKFAHDMLDWLSDYNETMEGATRLGAYKVALDSGMSRNQAASLAKNLTVNFNRKGRQAREIGALYAFFNAAVQGSARMVETLRSPAGKKIMAGGVLLGAMNAAIGLAMMGGGDDDDENGWMKIPEFVRERSLVIPFGSEDFVAIPLPLGFNVLPNIGRKAVEAMFATSSKSKGAQLADMLGMAVNAFNPFGAPSELSGTQLALMISPTVTDPVISLLSNTDWTGKPIYREDTNSLDPTPGHLRTKDTASSPSKFASLWLNKLSGGTDYRPGGISWTPDQIDYVIGQLTGGVGRELMKLNQTVTAPITGDELPAHKMPLLGRIYGNVRGPSAEAGRFYENVKMLNEVENELKGRLRDRVDTDEFRKQEPMVDLIGAGNGAEKQMRQLRKLRERATKEGNAARVTEINEQMGGVMKALNRKVMAKRNAPEPVE